MKTNLFCLIALLNTMCSCQQKKEVNKTFFPDGKLESKIIVLSKDEAKYVSYYKTGRIASEGTLDKDLAKEGEWKFLSPDGVITSSGEYSDDLKIGIWNYKLKDTSFSIEWEKYINRPLKLNLPKGWIIYENITAYSPLTAYTDNDSVNFKLGLNISIVEKGSGSLDSLALKGTQYFNNHFPSIRGTATDVVVNNIKAKKVIQYVMRGDKQIKTYRLYVPDGKMVYLLSLVLQEPEEEVFYNKVIEGIAESFQII